MRYRRPHVRSLNPSLGVPNHVKTRALMALVAVSDLRVCLRRGRSSLFRMLSLDNTCVALEVVIN